MATPQKKDDLSYKVKGFVCYVGMHYFVFMRSPAIQGSDSNFTNLNHTYDNSWRQKAPVSVWTLYNDTIIKKFKSWSEVV